jgi:hypothetical protein
MTERPRWVEAIRMFIADTVVDEEYDYPMDGSSDGLHDQIEITVNKIMCDTYGHEIIPDQCGKPEHRYCVYCQRRETDLLSPNDGHHASGYTEEQLRLVKERAAERRHELGLDDRDVEGDAEAYEWWRS